MFSACETSSDPGDTQAEGSSESESSGGETSGCGIGALGEWRGGVPDEWTLEQQECACALF